MHIVRSVLVLSVYAAKVDGFDTASLVFMLMCLVKQIIVFKHTEAQCYVKCTGRGGGVGRGEQVAVWNGEPRGQGRLYNWKRGTVSAGLTAVVLVCMARRDVLIITISSCSGIFYSLQC